MLNKKKMKLETLATNSMFTVYIVRTTENTLYTGQTNNLEKRLAQHRTKKSPGAKYLRLFDSFELVYAKEFETRSEAMQQEKKIKNLSREKKEQLISGDTRF